MQLLLKQETATVETDSVTIAVEDHSRHFPRVRSTIVTFHTKPNVVVVSTAPDRDGEAWRIEFRATDDPEVSLTERAEWG